MTLDGLLFFPVTPFSADGAVDTGRLQAHIRGGVEHGAGCVFAGCGTGEFNSLDADEVVVVARAAVEAAAGRAPVYVGVGSGSSSSPRVLGELEAAGVDGLLLLPPYLLGGSQRGLADYVTKVAASTRLDIIVYQRGEMVFEPETVLELSRIPNIVGLKDGVGDLARVQGIVSAIRSSGDTDFMFFNGLPTAELTMRAYKATGVPMYSSAVFAFAPEIALAFYDALHADDQELIEFLLTEFYLPFTVIRDRGKGYHVSLVKAAATVGSEHIGGVRPPLTEPAAADLDDLSRLTERVRTALEERGIVRRLAEKV
ncbi:5-dehydro-4-deoxyglucarate dehydratase [Naasia sp. SYSU D00057]|uniref:5-dehydro-4-deoxyglucarate dehydratase n=1 Tax=Naasia sp. SYSU D00057 TaxID=2817380 RepID=UPI001B304CF4|nr:5-dehydro-4-deoxyglucarate dehydratase [Naasia sp. SYSU D00057]